jgi:hypothetical protein
MQDQAVETFSVGKTEHGVHMDLCAFTVKLEQDLNVLCAALGFPILPTDTAETAQAKYQQALNKAIQ